MPGVPEAADQWITAPQAARRLGLALHTVYDLIDKGELEAEVVIPTDRPRRRRTVRLRRSAIDAFLDSARIRPGEIRQLHRP